MTIEKKGFFGLDHPRILLASILTAIMKIGIMDAALELDEPLGLANGLWVTIVYLFSYAVIGIALNAWRARRKAA